MKWFSDYLYSLNVDQQRVKNRVMREMAFRGFRDMVRQRLKTAHGTDLEVLPCDPSCAGASVALHDSWIESTLRDVNDGLYASIDEAVSSIAAALWGTWDSRFVSQPKEMKRYKKLRGHPARR
jgi:hypothetical protein